MRPPMFLLHLLVIFFLFTSHSIAQTNTASSYESDITHSSETSEPTTTTMPKSSHTSSTTLITSKSSPIKISETTVTGAASRLTNEATKPTDEQSKATKPTDEQSEATKSTDERSEATKPTKELSEATKPTKERRSTTTPLFTTPVVISTTEAPIIYDVVVTFNETYNPAYTNVSSSEFKNKAEEIEKTLRELLVNFIIDLIKVLSIERGSIIVKTEITFGTNQTVSTDGVLEALTNNTDITAEVSRVTAAPEPISTTVAVTISTSAPVIFLVNLTYDELWKSAYNNSISKGYETKTKSTIEQMKNILKDYIGVFISVLKIRKGSVIVDTKVQFPDANNSPTTEKLTETLNNNNYNFTAVVSKKIDPVIPTVPPPNPPMKDWVVAVIVICVVVAVLLLILMTVIIINRRRASGGVKFHNVELSHIDDHRFSHRNVSYVED